MTHAEATKDDRQGFISTCSGLLTLLGEYPDRLVTGSGTVRRVVDVYGCECGHDLSIVRETGEVLNDYARPKLTRSEDRRAGASLLPGPGRD